jgi:hypothetical protein
MVDLDLTDSGRNLEASNLDVAAMEVWIDTVIAGSSLTSSD